MAPSCEKGRNNVSKGCMKKVRAWQNIDNDVAKCQAGIGGHSNGETTLICKRHQVMDFASVGMNAASEGEEFRMLLKRVCRVPSVVDAWRLALEFARSTTMKHKVASRNQCVY